MNNITAIVAVAMTAIISAAVVAVFGSADTSTHAVELLLAFGAPAVAAMQVIILREVRQVAHQTNSITDELVAEVRKTSLAEGRAEGVAAERANPMTPKGE